MILMGAIVIWLCALIYSLLHHDKETSLRRGIFTAILLFLLGSAFVTQKANNLLAYSALISYFALGSLYPFDDSAECYTYY